MAPARRSLRHGAAATLAVVALAVGAVACSGDDGGDDNFPEATSDAGARGREIVLRSGCVACHNTDGRKTSGPGWTGLAGSEINLADGRTVVADDAYLTKAITQPKAEIRAGYAATMPEYLQLSEQDVADLIAYIRELPPAD